MSKRLHIQGEYPADWDQIGDRVREEAGHRCIRCGHPFRTGAHGKGQWTPCDDRCSHGSPLAWLLPDGSIDPISEEATVAARNFVTVARSDKNCGRTVVAEWRILTVHHMDGDKANCEWWNLLALCQRCHLTIQTRLNPELTYFLEHSAWAKPYVAGFYAKKYEGKLITRDEAVARMDELLRHERLA
jgi:hypothetical protein